METDFKSYANKLLKPFSLSSLKIAKAQPSSKLRYKLRHMSARETLELASIEGLSVRDYLEEAWNQNNNQSSITNTLHDLGVLNENIENILEIGTGAGLYVDKIVELCQPLRYESYETDRDWSSWLTRQYNIICHNADGKSLSHSEDLSVDLVLAHGVFMYVPFLITCQYFQEIVRVTKRGGYVAFDIFSEECFDDTTIKLWINSNNDLPCFLRKDYVVNFFEQAKFKLIGEFFDEKFDVGKSKYLVFERTSV